MRFFFLFLPAILCRSFQRLPKSLIDMSFTYRLLLINISNKKLKKEKIGNAASIAGKYAADLKNETEKYIFKHSIF